MVGHGLHDTLVYRLSMMLVKLNQGERLDSKSLADEFGVNVRTIQRDLNERFAYLPILKNGNYYSLDPAFLGKITLKDIERFAGLAGVTGLFPSLSDEFLRSMFDGRGKSALLVKGHHYENLKGREETFKLLERAITDLRHISFGYVKTDETKQYECVSPLKLMNHKGIWYLVASDSDKIKTFSFTKIRNVRLLETQFEPDSSVDGKLEAEDGIWMSESKINITLKISAEISEFFKRRKLVANQVIQEELGDGSLLMTTTVGHVNQVLPIVRYWIPYVHIVSPETLQSSLNEGLREYLKNQDNIQNEQHN